MLIVIITLLVIVVFLFVTEPFFSIRKLPNRFITRNLVRRKELQTHKENVLENIRELDLDSATGKVPGEDYQKLRKTYVSRFETISRELDGLGASNGLSDLKKRIEAEVKVMRKTSGIPVPAENSTICPTCSAENLTGNNFCSQCGAKLS